ncbi:MAG: hypothetical protein A9183_07135 [Dehalococcoides mccartyi]|jgi:hypothetical protein|uniref:hypothetical protein n=1 Tax=Dehalococcoides mccartyi TaxID=61435 RepID=UPI0008050887|nr:hypothetical protein [Dehalococcoides mccartyi]OBW63488.1 MAG: hypothetical protein A9183_07135 [Dehalococcoides mccartyi]
MHPVIRDIIDDFNPTLLNQLDGALELRVTNFKRDLFPSLEKIDLAIPGAGFQYVIWVKHEPKYPFPGWEFDPIARPMRYIPTYLASGMKFTDIARSIAQLSGGHVEECVKAFCETLNPPEHRYQGMPLGTLARQRRLIACLGSDCTAELSGLASVLINKAKHEFGSGSPYPIISFSDALGGYFASRILGFQVLQLGGILDRYVEAIRSAYSQRIAYTMPSGSDPGDDDKAWPLQSDLSELEENIEEY